MELEENQKNTGDETTDSDDKEAKIKKILDFISELEEKKRNLNQELEEMEKYRCGRYSLSFFLKKKTFSRKQYNY